MKLGADQIAVSRAALVSTDRYGKLVRDWAAATTTVVTGVAVQPISADEATVDREYAATHLRLFAPAGTDLLTTDRVVWRGTTFEVDGPPVTWYDLNSRADHVEATLKRMTG